MRRSRTALPFLSAEVRAHRDRAPGGALGGHRGRTGGMPGGPPGRLGGIPGGSVPARRLWAAISVLMALGVNYPHNGLLIIIRPCVIARRLRGIFQRDPGRRGGDSRSCWDIPLCPPGTRPPLISGSPGGAGRHRALHPGTLTARPPLSPRPPQRCRDASEAVPSGPGPGSLPGAVRRRFSGTPLLPPLGCRGGPEPEGSRVVFTIEESGPSSGDEADPPR